MADVDTSCVAHNWHGPRDEGCLTGIVFLFLQPLFESESALADPELDFKNHIRYLAIPNHWLVSNGLFAIKRRKPHSQNTWIICEADYQEKSWSNSLFCFYLMYISTIKTFCNVLAISIIRKRWWEDEEEKLFNGTIRSLLLHMSLSFQQNMWVKITGNIVLILDVGVKISQMVLGVSDIWRRI